MKKTYPLNNFWCFLTTCVLTDVGQDSTVRVVYLPSCQPQQSAADVAEEGAEQETQGQLVVVAGVLAQVEVHTDGEQEEAAEDEIAANEHIYVPFIFSCIIHNISSPEPGPGK